MEEKKDKGINWSSSDLDGEMSIREFVLKLKIRGYKSYDIIRLWDAAEKNGGVSPLEN